MLYHLHILQQDLHILCEHMRMQLSTGNMNMLLHCLQFYYQISKQSKLSINPFTTDPTKASHFAILVQPTIFNL